jgi:nucleotide-binding universal stress UspA family protein
MPNILMAVDGSEHSRRVAEQLVKMSRDFKAPPEVHVLTVQQPIAGVNVKIFVSHDSLNDYYREEGEAALKAAREVLDAAGIAYAHHIGVGHPAEVIAEYAKAKGCDQILMGTHGHGAFASMVLGSIATRVLHLAPVPVTLVR